MEVTLKEVLAAASPIEQFSKRRFKNFGIALNLAHLLKSIVENRDFYLAEERKLINEYAKKDDKGGIMFDESRTTILFNNPKEDIPKFNEALFNLQATKVDVANCPIVIHVNDVIIKPEEGFSPNDLIGLDPFVTFVDSVAVNPEVVK